jgi:hypothetical protein
MAEPYGGVVGPRQRRRRWVLCGVISALVLVGIVTWLVRLLVIYLQQPLTAQDSYTNVMSMFIGAVALLVSIASLIVAVLQLRHGTRNIPSAPVVPGGPHRQNFPPTPGETETKCSSTVNDEVPPVQIGIAKDCSRLFMTQGGDSKIVLHESPGATPPGVDIENNDLGSLQ